MLSRLFVQLPISFPVLLCYSLVDMRANIGASFVLILSYVSDRRELSLSEHKLENLFFFTCLTIFDFLLECYIQFFASIFSNIFTNSSHKTKS